MDDDLAALYRAAKAAAPDAVAFKKQTNDEWRKRERCADRCSERPHLGPVAEDLDPDGTGGAVLLGTAGICVISHGSSNAKAIVNAVRVAAEAVEQDLVGRIAAAVTSVRELEDD